MVNMRLSEGFSFRRETLEIKNNRAQKVEVPAKERHTPPGAQERGKSLLLGQYQRNLQESLTISLHSILSSEKEGYDGES